MKIKAKFDRLLFTENGAVISFLTADKFTVGQVAERMNKTADGINMELAIDITLYKSKRSIEQNRLMWEMLDLLTREINKGLPQNKRHKDVWDIYCIMLEQCGAKYEYILSLPEAEKMLKESFRAITFVESRDYNGKKMNMYKCFYGSSKFNTKEMTEFINAIQDELRELGVDYENISSM